MIERHIFISHSSIESELAISLAEWLEKNFPSIRCFCSSRPNDIAPGTNWIQWIRQKATSSFLCLSFISPDSLSNPWVHFESGLLVGSSQEKVLVPVVYGGTLQSSIPHAMRAFQCLWLDQAESFDAFLSKYILTSQPLLPHQQYLNFKNQLSFRANRLISFGELGILQPGKIKTLEYTRFTLNGKNSIVAIPRYTTDGKVVSIRISAVPRRLGPVYHWKLGKR